MAKAIKIHLTIGLSLNSCERYDTIILPEGKLFKKPEPVLVFFSGQQPQPGKTVSYPIVFPIMRYDQIFYSGHLNL
ncbi:MAG: hypothetical protein PHS94_07170 [Erysipelotrichaceae bacterium]|nr:hypothetical protein [Erysipelotrichaceae bacterium]